MKRKTLLGLVVLFLACMLAFSGSAVAAKRFFGIATGGVGGVYYPLGGACAQCLTNKIPDMIVTAQSGNASVANTNLIARGEVESGLAQNNIAFAAYKGLKESWKTPPVPQLRGIASMYPETIHIVALKDAGIHSIYDLKGKRVIVGDKGSGTEFDSRRILEAIGLTYDDIQPIFVYYATAVQRMKDEQADALFWTAGVPTASIIEIATTKDVVFLPFPDKVAAKLQEKYPYYARVQMPANSYQGQTEPINTIAMMALWVTSADVSEKDIYDVTYNLWEDTPLIYRKGQEKVSCAKVLAKVHKQGENVKLENALLGMTIPLHIGAYKYYKEKGIDIPPEIVPPEAK
jgi:TRAP transporter TAXI family solute receptor